VSRRSKYTTYPIGPLSYQRTYEAVKSAVEESDLWREGGAGREALRKELTAPFTWLVQSYMFDAEFAVRYPDEVENYPRFGDASNVMYTSDGDIIHGVFDGITGRSNWPSFVAKIKRPKTGIVGGEVEWKWVPPDGGVGDVTPIYHSRALGQTLVRYKGKIYILDEGGNLIRTIKPAVTLALWNTAQPNMIFYNDKQILVADWKNHYLYILNMDGSVAWSLALTPPEGAGWGPLTVWSFITNWDERYIFFCWQRHYVQRIKFEPADQYSLPPEAPTVEDHWYAPRPRAISAWRGGKEVLLDCIDGEEAFGYLHINPDDMPFMCIPFVNSNSVDIHPSLPRAIFTHAFSIYELDLYRAIYDPPFKHGFSNLYVGRPGTSEGLLGWTYTKRLSKVIFHVYNAMDVDATVRLYFMYPYSTTGKVQGQMLNTLTPPPTPSIEQTVSSGTSTDIILSAPPLAVLVRGLSAAAPTSGNLVVSVYGEV